MPEERAGRNDPCPCGSGKKHKKCCWGKETPVREVPPAQSPFMKDLARELRAFQEGPDPLDVLSNSAIDAIKAGRHEEAEKLCERLLTEYPDIIDPYDRLGMLREAQGRFLEAAEQYSRALDIVVQNPNDYDPAWVSTFERRRDQALAKAKAPA